MAELLDIFDADGNLVGQAPRSECHGNPKLLHHTAHVVVRRSDGKAILLQKRVMTKDIQPGKWDTAVGGHLDAGESYETGARRELAEELGVRGDVKLIHLFDSKIRNAIESEDVRVFMIEHDGPVDFQREEIDEVRFWTKSELATADPSDFTPNLLAELARLEEISFW